MAFAETQHKCAEKEKKLEGLQVSMGALKRRHRQLELKLAQVTFESNEKDQMIKSTEQQLAGSEEDRHRSHSEVVAAHVAVAKKEGELSAIRVRLADVQVSHKAADAAASKAQTAGAEKAMDVISLQREIQDLELKNKDLDLLVLESKASKTQVKITREDNSIL